MNLPFELTTLKRWVGARKDNKCPIKCIPDNKVDDESASVSNQATWQTFEDACCGLGLCYCDNIGFVFYEPDGFVAIDIDDGKDDFGLFSDKAFDIITKCKSYTEESRSGRGYHIILKGKLPFLGKNNRQGVEIYKGGRYFIMTGKQTMYDKIIENQEAIDYVVEKYFPEYRPSKEKESTTKAFYTPVYEKPKQGKISFKQVYPEIKQGCRNQSLASLAGQLHVKGYDMKQTYCELLKANQQCKPPLSQGEIQCIVESIFRYER